MHILIVSHNYPNSYNPIFGFFCKDQAVALSQFGHKVGVISPLAIRASELVTKKLALGFSCFIKDGVIAELFAFPSIPKLKRFRYFLIKKIGIYLLNKYIKRNGRPDVIHLQVFNAVQIANFAKQNLGIPFVYTEHFSSIERNLLTNFEINLVYLAAKNSIFNIAVSSSFAKSLTDYTKQKFIYIPNVYKSDLFKLEPHIKKYECFTFVNIGSLDSNKNHTRLIKAFKRFNANQPKSQLLIIGNGPDRNSIINLIKKEQLGLSVHLKGYLNSTEIKNMLSKSHTFVLSSNYETFGVSIIEALACGIPVVSTKCGGPESIITNNKIGILCKQNEESLFLGMKTLYDNYREYDFTEIANFAIKEYSNKSIAKKLTSVYKECIN